MPSTKVVYYMTSWVAAIPCHLQRWSFTYNPYTLYQGGLCSYGLGSGYNMPSTKVVFCVPTRYIRVGCATMAWVAAITCHLQRWSFTYNPYLLYQGGLCSYGLRNGNRPSPVPKRNNTCWYCFVMENLI